MTTEEKKTSPRVQDMIVRLYDLPDDWSFIADQARKGVIIRKPMGAEQLLVQDWVREQHGLAWASETGVALSNSPMSCFIAIREKSLVGFSCYDAVALGFFGPLAVDEQCRNLGIGKALLLAALSDMKLKGYAYGIIAATHIPDYYARAVGAIPIPDSSPGFWRNCLLH